MAHRITEQSFEVLPSAARTASPPAEDYYGIGESQGANGRRQDESSVYAGLAVVVNVTATAALSSTVTVKVQGVDEFSGTTWDIADTGALSAAGQHVLRVHPGLTAVANEAVSDLVPPRFRVVAEHAGAESFTYQVSAHLTY